MTQLPFRSAAGLAAAVRAREISSTELLDCYLDMIERLNPGLGAVVTLDADRARREAAAADRLLAQGAAAGPLHGLPVTVKDCLETAGLRTTCGAPELAGYVPERDAEAVARLRRAGAIGAGRVPPLTACRWASRSSAPTCTTAPSSHSRGCRAGCTAGSPRHPPARRPDTAGAARCGVRAAQARMTLWPPLNCQTC